MNKLIKKVLEFKKTNDEVIFEEIIHDLDKVKNYQCSKMVKFYNEDLRQELLFEIYKTIPKYEPLKKLTLKNEETSKIYLIYKNISRSKYYKSFIKKYKIKDDIEDKKNIVELINEFYLFCNENQFKKFISVICKRRRIDFYRKNKISNDLNNFRLNDIASDGEEYIYKVIDEKNTNKFEVDYSLLSNKDREFLKLFFEDGVRIKEKEVAKKIGVSQQAVSSRLKRIKNRYKNIINKLY